MAPSQTALRLAVEQRSSVITEDLTQTHLSLQGAQSVVAQRLRSVVVIPLYAGTGTASGQTEAAAKHRDILGVLYLDSQSAAAFSALDLQLLDAIAIQAASILDNARLVALERQREHLEQELSIARNIQQALLPRAIPDLPHLTVDGFSSACLEVGGDYYDVFPLDQERTAFLVGDVSGKGLGAALVATMLQGALSSMSVASSPAHVFDHLNRVLCEHVDVGRYISLFFGGVDRGGRLDFIRAGHPSPVLIRGGEITEPFTQGCFPVGLIPEARYSASVLQLEPADTLVLFSDGVTEAEDASLSQFQSARHVEIKTVNPTDRGIDLQAWHVYIPFGCGNIQRRAHPPESRREVTIKPILQHHRRVQFLGVSKLYVDK